MTAVATAEAKDRAQRTIAAVGKRLIELSRQIHDHPELGFEEERASAWCAEALAEAGFAVETGVCELPTAFSASAGTGPLNIAICAEYDALPEVGHACGHNVIASAAIGAGLGLAALADDLGITVRVLGTPAEEGGGGKILMLEGGAFDGVNAALMVHPAPIELDRMPCLAVSHFDVRYKGKEAHASAYPERGINAADAVTIAQVAIGLLRQQSAAHEQVHGIVTYGGAAPNIVPGLATAKFYVRAQTLEAMKSWEPKVLRCFEAGALATGAELEVVLQGPRYSEFSTDEEMATIYRVNAEAIGRVFTAGTEDAMTASTDMGNVSIAIPSIHPMLGIDSLPAVNHQAGFAAAAVSPAADRAVLDGALAMARTVIDIAGDENQRQRLGARAYRHA
jgi:amidohydrolase